MIGFFVFAFGSCFGSFLNVCIYRCPRRVSVVKPNSFCPGCKVPLKWRDNIPVIGYLLLRGRCRNCKTAISLRYPLIELLTAVLFLGMYLKYGINFYFFKYCFFFALMIIVSFIDIDWKEVPVSLCALGMVSGIIFSLYETGMFLGRGGIQELNDMPILVSVKSLLLAVGFTYVFKFFADILMDFYLKIRGKDSIEGEKEALGLGDVDFMGVIGLFLGIKMAVLTFFMAPFFAIVYALVAIIFKRSHVIPYIPYLSLAGLFSFVWGDRLLMWLGY